MQLRTIGGAVAATMMLVLSGCSTSADNTTHSGQVSADQFDAALVEAARGEGEVVYYTVQPNEEAELLAKGFEATFGIPVRLVRDDTGSIIQQIEAQVAANAVAADIVVLADGPVLQKWSRESITEFVDVPNRDALTPDLFNAEVGAIPMGLNLFGLAYNPMNTEAPVSWEQVAEGLDGPIAMADPNGSAAAVATYAQISNILGDDWLQRVAQNNEILTADSAGTTHQMLLSGEADYSIPGGESHVLRSKLRGEPLDIAYMEEGVVVNTMDIAKLVKAPHPSAATLMVQYQLNREAQEALTGSGARSVLADVAPPEGGQDVSGRPMLSSELATYAADRDKIRALWAEAIRGQ